MNEIIKTFTFTETARSVSNKYIFFLNFLARDQQANRFHTHIFRRILKAIMRLFLKEEEGTCFCCCYSADSWAQQKMSFSTGIVSLSHSHVLQNSCAVINESLTLFFSFVPNVFIFFPNKKKDLDQLLLVSNEEEKL